MIITGKTCGILHVKKCHLHHHRPDRWLLSDIDATERQSTPGEYPECYVMGVASDVTRVDERSSYFQSHGVPSVKTFENFLQATSMRICLHSR